MAKSKGNPTRTTNELPQLELTPEEKQMVAISLGALPPDLRTPSVVRMLTTALRSPDFARRLRADPRRCLEEAGQELPGDMPVEVHVYSKDTIHLMLLSPESLAARHEGKIHLSDSELMSGTAIARLASDKKKDGNDGKASSDSDDKGDKGSWTTDDRGDGATDIGDRRRQKNPD